MGNRIRKLRKQKGLSGEDLAKQLSTTRQTIHRLETGKIQLTSLWAERIAKVLDSDPATVLGFSPDEVDDLSIDRAPDVLPAYSGSLAEEIIEIGGSEYVSVGRYDAALSAGPGSVLDPDAEPLGFHLFEAQWLRSVTRAAPAHLAVLRVDGDSMEDTLRDGDFVLVDRSQNRFGREGIYALAIGENAWVKRLSLNLRERLIRVISDNPAYPQQELDEHELFLIGRVVWIVGRKV